MALVRILVDGFSLLHAWPELAPGRPRHSPAARQELIHRLTQHQDATRTPITVFFDGGGGHPSVANNQPQHPIEVLYSRRGKTADDLIERAAFRFQPYGEVLAVSNDQAVRATVMALGGFASSCGAFIRVIERAEEELQSDLKHHNRREQSRFKV